MGNSRAADANASEMRAAKLQLLLLPRDVLFFYLF